MNHAMFRELRNALSPFYLPEHPPVVGYLRGSNSAGIWRAKSAENKPQMIILGNEPPSDTDWANAGVGDRTGDTKAITFPELNSFIILHDSFPERPWGVIAAESEDAVNLGFPYSLKQWREQVAKRGL